MGTDSSSMAAQGSVFQMLRSSASPRMTSRRHTSTVFAKRGTVTPKRYCHVPRSLSTTAINLQSKDSGRDELPEIPQWQRSVLTLMGFYSADSTRIRAVNRMYENCLAHAYAPELAEALGLDDSFESRYRLLSLHIWMCLAKLRCCHGEYDGRKMAQILFDNFWDDMQMEIRKKQVRELEVNKWLVELQEMFFGAAVSYDESIVSSDAVLAEALARNLFGFQVSAQHLSQAVYFVRRQSVSIDKMAPEYFCQGEFAWDKCFAVSKKLKDRENVQLGARGFGGTLITEQETKQEA